MATQLHPETPAADHPVENDVDTTPSPPAEVPVQQGGEPIESAPPDPSVNRPQDPERRQRTKMCCCFFSLVIFMTTSLLVSLALSQSAPETDDDRSTRGRDVTVETLPFEVVSIVTDSGHSCAIMRDSEKIQCWGMQIGVPSNLVADVSTQLAVGDGFTCALLSSGDLQCWGEDGAADYVQPPEDLGLVDFVAASGGTVCTISKQGQGRCWGFYLEGRVELLIPASGPLLSIATSKLGELPRVCGILKENNRLQCWKSDMNVFVMEELPLRGVSAKNATDNIQSVAVMRDFVCVIDWDGLLSCWVFEDAPLQTILPSFLSSSTSTVYSVISPGRDNSFCALSSDADPICYGTSSVIPRSVGPLEQLSIGTNHMCGIQRDSFNGVCWGASPRPGELAPLLLEPLYAFRVASGVGRTCSVDWYQNKVECWGQKRYQLVVDATDISVGNEVTCVVDRNDELAKCVVGQGTHIFSGRVDSVVVSRHQDTICTLTNSKVQCFQVSCQKQIFQQFYTCSGSKDFSGNPESALGKVSQLELSLHHYCWIDLDDQILCGSFDLGQNSTYPQSQVPSDVTSVRDMALGRFFTCAVRDDFSVRCWGEETQYGQEFVLETPQGSYYRAIAATDNEVCAITLDDYVHCWGRPFSSAIYIPDGVSFVKELTAGSGHFCVILDNQQFICWGSNRYGELSPEHYG